MVYLVRTKGQVVTAKQIPCNWESRNRGGSPCSAWLGTGWRSISCHRRMTKASKLACLAEYLQAQVAPGGAWDNARQAAWQTATIEKDTQESGA